jgi:hypothetical protein
MHGNAAAIQSAQVHTSGGRRSKLWHWHLDVSTSCHTDVCRSFPPTRPCIHGFRCIAPQRKQFFLIKKWRDGAHAKIVAACWCVLSW